jgi:polysaccharide deacetylase 2 family uncharacterized protein YibQ
MSERWLTLLLAGVLGALVAIVGGRVLSGRAPADAPAKAAAEAGGVAPPAPGDPGPARDLMVQALSEAGVMAVGHGAYPLRGAGRRPDETLPLVSFDVPAGADRNALLARLEEKATAAGFSVARSGRPDLPERPAFRALARDGHPVLALRAFPPGPRLTLVVDDVGLEPGAIDALLALDDNVTFAVLANAPYAARVAQRLETDGREVIAHIPMEPMPPEQPDGPDFLTLQQSEDEAATALEALLDKVPGAVGASNHLGGRLTTSRPHMGAVLGVLQKRALFFLDDRTSPASVAEVTAQAMGVRVAARTHYLDVPGQDLTANLRAVEAALVLQGHALVVARPEPATLTALKPWLEDLRRRNIHLLRLSEIVL